MATMLGYTLLLVGVHIYSVWACQCIEEERGGTKCTCPGTAYRNLNRSSVRHFSIVDSNIEFVDEDLVSKFSSVLQDIYFSNVWSLYDVAEDTFQGTLQLRSLSIVNAPKLTSLPSNLLTHLKSLKTVKIMRTGLTHIPMFPNFGHSVMETIDLEGNRIGHLTRSSFHAYAEHVYLGYNEIENIDGWAFNESQIYKLSLCGNLKLKFLHEDSFQGIQHLQDLDLSSTSIEHLPISGLQNLEVLLIENTFTLRTIPSIYDLKKLRVARLTFSFHCCAFQFPEKHDPQRHAQYQKKMAETCQNKSKMTRQVAHGLEFATNKSHQNSFSAQEFVEEFMDIPVTPVYRLQVKCGNISWKKQSVECTPVPDAFNPCEDIMGSVWLRACVWFVISTAFVGNAAVIIVTLNRASEKSVPRLLISHLAFADLCMALYLLLLALKDLQSTEFYFNYAYEWQKGYGCQVAGFVTVFASQLSIYTLGVITLERWYSIRRALYTNKLTNGRTTHFIIVGYVYSAVMASLPLFGVSNYSSTSICLPMDTRDVKAQLYVYVLLMFTGIVFCLICVCYIQIYSSLDYNTRHNQGESKIARKMAFLVLVNFACWAPVSFFAFTAAVGYPLISVTHSKILLVFFYPINSCFNPYLYALLTKLYRRDLVLTLSRCGVCTQRAHQYRMISSGLTGLHSLSSRKQSHDEGKHTK